MFNLGLSEIVLISIIALIFIGPKQLPEIARALGRALNELKRASEDLTSTITNPKNYHQQENQPTPPPTAQVEKPSPRPLYDGYEETTPHEEAATVANPETIAAATKKDEGSST